MGPSIPAGKGIVTGGIDWCSGIEASGPKYAPGRVNVYPGWANQRSWRALAAWRSHARPVLHTHVGTNGTYRFVLRPGRYTLTGTEGKGNSDGIKTITIQQGAILHADIPTGCL